MTRKYTKKSSGSTASTTASTNESSSSSSSSGSKKRKNTDDKSNPITKIPNNSLTPVHMLFEKYKDEDLVVGPEGVSKFITDLGLAPDSLEVLILAWTMEAEKMGYFKQNEFMKGFEKLGCSDLPSLKNELISLGKKIKQDNSKFTELYKYSFGFASDVESKKSVDLATASEMLKLILPDGPHTNNFIAFLNTNPYKSINRDQWLCFLEFSRTVKSDLSNFDHSEAWPLLLDQFVEFTNGIKKE